MHTNTVMKSNIICLIFLLLTLALILVFSSGIKANGEFSVRIIANNVDIFKVQTINIDTEEDLVINLEIYNVTRELTLKELSLVVTFGGIDILTRSEDLGNFVMMEGDSYKREIIIDTNDLLRAGDRPLITGLYPSKFKLEYKVNDQEMVWSQRKNLNILGNPLNTPIGLAGLLVGFGTVIGFFSLAWSLAVQNIHTGITLAPGVSVRALSHLKELVSDRLEPTARGRITGNIVSEAKKRIIKDKCPICDTRLKHGYCFTCKKSAKEVREEYRDKLRDLCLQGSQLLADDRILTMDELCSTLGIRGKLGTDVIATLKNAKLVKAKGIARKLSGKAVTAGIGTGLSTIIWVTVGGLAVLGTSALIGILIASIVVPFILIKTLQFRAKRSLRKSMN